MFVSKIKNACSRMTHAEKANDDVFVDLHCERFDETDNDYLTRGHKPVNHPKSDENCGCHQIRTYHPEMKIIVISDVPYDVMTILMDACR